MILPKVCLHYNVAMIAPFEWDNNSDQPYQLKDRNFKIKMRKKERFSLLKTILISLVVLPIALLAMPFKKRQHIDSQKLIGLGIDVIREPEVTLQMLSELEVNTILIRLGLWEMEKVATIATFLDQVPHLEVTLIIMQDREHIDDSTLLRDNLNSIFMTLSSHIARFQIGSTINRAKWGFFSVNEYLNFYNTAYTLRNKEFPNISLLGPSVIDFEYHFTIHALFNRAKIAYDGLSALLYVDRRGAPENMQMGFTLLDKISLLSSLMNLSNKVNEKLYITETNWPISNTAPFAPTSEHECVSEEDYASFMVRYYLLSYASQRVETIFWHQLIAPGYGLVDNRNGIRKRSAYYAFKTLHNFLKDTHFLRLGIERGFYTLQCATETKITFVMWMPEGSKPYNIDDSMSAFSRDGEPIGSGDISITSKPIYIIVER